MFRPDLRLVLHYEDEWPTRVGEFIADLAEWYAAHPSLSEQTASAIASTLEDVAAQEIAVHERSVSRFSRDAAGQAVHTLNSSVPLEDLRRALALAAFERYGLAKVA